MKLCLMLSMSMIAPRFLLQPALHLVKEKCRAGCSRNCGKAQYQRKGSGRQQGSIPEPQGKPQGSTLQQRVYHVESMAALQSHYETHCAQHGLCWLKRIKNAGIGKTQHFCACLRGLWPEGVNQQSSFRRQSKCVFRG